MASGLSSLGATGIIEKDTNDDVMLTWSYPSIDARLEPILINRSRLEVSDDVTPFSFSRFETQWIYIFTTTVEHELEPNENDDPSIPKNLRGIEYSGPLGRVKAFSICLLAKDYNPELYGSLAKVFADGYKKTGTPITVLQCFLRALTSGTVMSWNQEEYPARNALIATSIKDVIRLFGIEIILLWSALMMKKRIVVFCDRISTLLRVIRAFPLFIWHRRDWDSLRPYVNVEPVEIAELEQAKIYVAGFIDGNIKNRPQLYDLFVDINARAFVIPEHAKADFRLGSFHKELAEFLVESAENEELEGLDVIKALAMKTQEFIAKLHSLQDEDEEGNKTVTLEGLQQRQIPATMQQFLYAVAAAEGLTR